MIVKPNGNGQVLHVNNISKEKLARICNEQSEEIKMLRGQLQNTVRVLIAIALEPEALDYQSGRVKIDRGALGKVQRGMQIKFEFDEDQVYLRLVMPDDVSAIEVPKIVGMQ